MRYAIVIEQGSTSFGAYVPDLSGCIAAAETRDEVVRLIREAIEGHIQLLREDGQPVPEPRSTAEYADVQVA
jgi:predicted RNase H-like HicB family nuclease